LAGPTAYRLAYQRPGPLGTLARVEQKLGDTETMAFVRGSSILQSGILDKRKQKNNPEENGEMIDIRIRKSNSAESGKSSLTQKVS